MTYEAFRKKIRARFEELSEQEQVQTMPFRGEHLQIFPQVFSPKLFSESVWFGKQLTPLCQGKKLLEVGTGTGIIAIMCAQAGARVTATDINPEAVRNAQENFQTYNVEGQVYYADVYTGLPEDKKYDIIFWNHPFNLSTEPEKKDLLKSIFDYRYKALEQYVAQARNYLTQNGRLLLGTGNLADFKQLERIAQRHNYTLKELSKDRCYIDNDDFELYCQVLEFIQQ